MKRQSASVKVKDIRVNIRSQPVLNGVNLDFEPGSCTAILGTSGCGKSTLLKAVVGLVPLDAGEIFINGIRMCKETALELRKEIGYCVQDGGLFPHMTLYENIVLMASIKGWTKSRIKERLHHLLGMTQLKPEILARYPFQVSGGQRQRVGLVRTLFLDPMLVILDEPMGALDPIVRTDLQNDLKEIFKQLKKTVIMVTHDIGEALHLSNRMILVKDGSVVQSGPVREFIERPADAFVKRFIQSQKGSLIAQSGGVSIA